MTSPQDSGSFNPVGKFRVAQPLLEYRRDSQVECPTRERVIGVALPCSEGARYVACVGCFSHASDLVKCQHHGGSAKRAGGYVRVVDWSNDRMMTNPACSQLVVADNLLLTGISNFEMFHHVFQDNLMRP